MNFGVRDYSFNNGDKPAIIAEIGVNHNGDLDIARRMVDAAIEAGADIIKFQAFRSEKEISKYAIKAPYQEETTSSEGNQLEMCKALELSADALKTMQEYCDGKNAPFLCAAFDFDSVDLLVDELKVETIKIPSGEVTNIPFLRYIGSKNKSVILSTGASTLDEVALAVKALKDSGCPELALLHCVSSYPAPYDQVNLKTMLTMKETFNIPVGFSDHTVGNHAAIAAAALGAAAIEKHFTLDRNMPGPDHRASIEPDELKELVCGVKIAHDALGDGIKVPVPCEIPNLPLIRKSLVASTDLPKGTKLTREMIEIKRPEGGIAPADLDKVLGSTLKHGIDEDMLIRWEDLI
jgi:N-acetylneuraminate synthase